MKLAAEETQGCVNCVAGMPLTGTIVIIYSSPLSAASGFLRA